MIEIDGSHEEGGGSILRLSLAFSIYTQKPFRITNIRKYRKKPGLNSQNLASIELARQISNAKVVGARRGSNELEFYPNELISKNVEVNIGSAGSIALALQSILLPCIFSGKKYTFKITGGTDVAWSPGYDYFNEVFLPYFEDYTRFECTLQRRGYYPVGGGKMTLKINSLKDTKLKKMNLGEFGRLITIRGVSNASKDLEDIDHAEREANAAIAILQDFNEKIDIKRTYAHSDSTGAGLLIYGVYELTSGEIFRSGIYKVSPITAKTVSEEVSKEFINMNKEKIVLDEFHADQLLPFLGLMSGEMKTTPINKHLSKHLMANVYVIEKFLHKKIKVQDDGHISCT